MIFSKGIFPILTIAATFGTAAADNTDAAPSSIRNLANNNSSGGGNGNANGHTNPNNKNKYVSPQESIKDAIDAEHANGKSKARLTLAAQLAGSSSEQIEVNVIEAKPAITGSTTISNNGGAEVHVNEDDLASLLVSSESSVFAMLAVEADGSTHGVIHGTGGGPGNHKNHKFTQAKGNGKKSFAEELPDFEPKEPWACGVGAEHIIDPNDKEKSRRHLTFDGHSHDDHHHDHHDHKHHDHHHHHDHDIGNTLEALEDVQRSLRGSTLRLGKRRELQDESLGYSHWVDIYVEVDNALCVANGEDCAANGLENSPLTINYVNAIFTGANTIYEPEIDTHINVLHLAYTSIYDGSGNAGTALNRMMDNYSAGSWHYTSSEGDQPDLHHALLAGPGGGGVAYKSTICNSAYGYGVSASLEGNYASMDLAATWDMTVFMHELGHNFGTGHTHDGGYDPIIDSCGCKYSGGYCNDNCIFDADGACTSSCPSELSWSGDYFESSTIMSYCHTCSGGTNNLKYTFGGQYTGTGSRSDVNSYTNTELVGNISNNAKRVNVAMYNHVNSRGECTNVPGVIPTPPPTPPPVASTPIPTNAPSTPFPTNAPTPFDGVMAEHDGSFGAPRCATTGKQCSSGLLLDGRATMGPEPNSAANTIDGCADGSSGTYHSDESNDKIVVSSINGQPLQAGGIAKVEATVYAWSTGSADTADFYHTEDTNSINWIHIGSVSPGGGGAQTVTSPEFTLSNKSDQAVRVRFRYDGAEGPCSNGNYDDTDDLVFAVVVPTTSNPTKQPTPQPVTPQPVTDAPITSAPITPAPITPAPTPNPTPGPTNQPTDLPVTSLPTKNPTNEPTPNPTPQPVTSTPAPVTPAPSKQPTDQPVTDSPSKQPTDQPVTDSPSKQPTDQPVTDSPSKQPTDQPVTDSPSKQPTDQPTDSPTTPELTPAPQTASPSKNPTNEPTTPELTPAPQTASPSKNPTNEPTPNPVTPNPTNEPTPNPVTPAPQAATLTPISCNTSQTSSTSGLAPANIAACGTSTGTGGAKWYKLTGATAGQTVTITTCSATTDFDTKLSVWGDKNTPSTCIGGNDDDCNLQSTVTFEEASGDVDILVHGYSSSEGTFELSVTCVSPPQPTLKPTPQPVTPTPPGENLVATYDASFGAPMCASVAKSCTTGTQLIKGTKANVETGDSNTIDSCRDGLNGGYLADESIEMLEVSGKDGIELQAGGIAVVSAQVWAYSGPSVDFADIYYTADATAQPPVWTFLGTSSPSSGGMFTISTEYILPNNPIQAVRVNFRYYGSRSSCEGGSWGDTDDLVFTVSPLTGNLPRQEPMPMPMPGIPNPSSCDLHVTQDRCDDTGGLCYWKNRGRGCIAA